MLLDEAGHHLAIGCQGANRGFFILAHQPTVALDIGAQDSGQLAFHTALAGSNYPAPAARLSKGTRGGLGGDRSSRFVGVSGKRTDPCDRATQRHSLTDWGDRWYPCLEEDKGDYLLINTI